MGLDADLSVRLAALPPLRRQLLERELAARGRRPAVEHPLSFGQEALWFLNQVAPESAYYNNHAAVVLRGRLHTDVLERSLAAVVARHASLRSVFRQRSGRPIQAVAQDAVMTLDVVDLARVATPDAELRRDAVSRRLSEREATRPFDLERGPVIRAALLCHGPDCHTLLLTMHHIVSDGWSLGVLVRELQAFYGAFRAGVEADLPALPMQCGDVAAAERRHADSEAAAAGLAYWRQQLAGIPVELPLPLDRPRRQAPNTRGGRHAFRLSADEARVLEAGCRECGVTLFMGLLGALQALLFRYSNESDIVVGAPVANRGTTAEEQLIGPFVNTVVLRNRVASDLTFRELLERVRVTCAAAFAHQSVPFERVVDALQPERHPGRNPLFQVMLTLQNAPMPTLDLPGLRGELVDIEDRAARLDLELQVWPRDTGYSGWLCHSDLFEAATVARINADYWLFARELLVDPDRRIGDVALSAPAMPLCGQASVASKELIHDLIARRAELVPDAVALVHGDSRLTYGALWSRVRRAALTIAQAGADVGGGHERRVAVCMQRGADLFISILAVLASGAAYVPLEPRQPDERLAEILKRSQATLLLHDEATATREFGADVPMLDAAMLGSGSDADDRPGAIGPGVADQLAYLIYTSGSTGGPKGVMVTHANVTGLFDAMDERIDSGPGVWLAVASAAFDLSVTEVMWPLTRGGTVVVYEGDDETGLQEAPLAFGLLSRGAVSTSDIAACDVDHFDEYRSLLLAARFADRNGFRSFAIPERHFRSDGGPCPNAAVAAAAIAVCTENVEIRASGVAAALHLPVRVAEDWALIDNLSEGRASLAFSAKQDAEGSVLVRDTDRAGADAMFSCVQDVRRLWRGDAITMTAPDGADVAVRTYPRPLRGELPVWIAASGGQDEIRRAAQERAGLCLELRGHDEESLDELEERVASYRAVWRECQCTGRGPVAVVVAVGESDAVDGAAWQSTLARLRFLEIDEVLWSVNVSAGQEEVARRLRELLRAKNTSERVARSCATVAQLIDRHGVTHLQCTPSRLTMVLADDDGPRTISGLRQLILGGELMRPALAEQLERLVPGRFLNGYGPTETTVWSTTHRVVPVEGPIPIGKPLANTELRFVDAAGEAAPTAVPAELSIGGTGVARGYDGRPGLTAERFVPDPEASVAGARAFRTRELARLDNDGVLEFHGRTDNQVKIRGYRVEPGEIESALEQHPAISRAIVTPSVMRSEDAPNALIAHFIGVAGMAPGDKELRRYLQSRLPDYMIPAAFVPVPAFPLTMTGKLDRLALVRTRVRAEDRLIGDDRESADFVPPGNALERQIAVIWQELLDVQHVSVDDNFFELGGNSLMLVEMQERLRTTLGVPLTIPTLFRHPTIAALADHVTAGPAGAGGPVSGSP